MEIHLMDGPRLAHMAESVGIRIADNSVSGSVAHAVRTTEDSAFPRVLMSAIFSPQRYVPGTRGVVQPNVTRDTRYVPYYLAEFQASGDARTAGDIATASWSDLIWLSASDGRCDVGKIPDSAIDRQALVSLADAQRAAQGPAEPPRVMLHEAPRRMKDHLLRTLSIQVKYTGANNRAYRKSIRPKARGTDVGEVRLVYVPRQTFAIGFPNAHLTGQLLEDARSFTVVGAAFTQCSVCARHTTPAEQVFCAHCHRGAHRHSFLHPDTFPCARCKAVVCANDIRKYAKETVCVGCAPPIGSKAFDRLRPHKWTAAAGILAAVLLAILSDSPLLGLLLGTGACAPWVIAGSTLGDKPKHVAVYRKEQPLAKEKVRALPSNAE